MHTVPKIDLWVYDALRSWVSVVYQRIRSGFAQAQRGWGVPPPLGS